MKARNLLIVSALAFFAIGCGKDRSGTYVGTETASNGISSAVTVKVEDHGDTASMEWTSQALGHVRANGPITDDTATMTIIADGQGAQNQLIQQGQYPGGYQTYPTQGSQPYPTQNYPTQTQGQSSTASASVKLTDNSISASFSTQSSMSNTIGSIQPGMYPGANLSINLQATKQGDQ